MSFNGFWLIYPKRVAKKKAKKAWDKALRDGATEAEILDGACRYANERVDENPKFTKHPSTWLNGGCWADDPGANGPQREKGFADIADDLRRDLSECNGARGSEDQDDLFGATVLASARTHRSS
jgi:hypothetical protein